MGLRSWSLTFGMSESGKFLSAGRVHDQASGVKTLQPKLMRDRKRFWVGFVPFWAMGLANQSTCSDS